MFLEPIIRFFLPAAIRHDKAHPRYYELYTSVALVLVGSIFISLFPLLLFITHTGKHLGLYYVNVASQILILLSIRFLRYFQLANIICGFLTYCIIYNWIDDYGLIYSSNISLVTLFLLGGVLSNKKWGWLCIFSNLLFLCFIYYRTIVGPLPAELSPILGNPVYSLAMYSLITVAVGSFLYFSIRNQERSRIQIKALQDQKINLLDEAVRQRTEQLNNMRQGLASDFHDQTGNMLSAITRQASMLEIKLIHNTEVLPVVKSIISNSNELYAASRDFLWNLNHESDNPLVLFQYLTAYGQKLYNQFDVSFSAHNYSERTSIKQLDAFAALNLIYIFKEAMTNIIKHANATEVVMILQFCNNEAAYSLCDNGSWKQSDTDIPHYGLQNMERRCQQHGFGFQLSHDIDGTKVSVSLPLHTYIVQSSKA